MVLTVGTNYSLSILKGQVFVKEAICSGNLGIPLYYFRDFAGNDCNISMTGLCLQGNLSPGETGPVQNFGTPETIGVTIPEISFNTGDNTFNFSGTGVFEVEYNISHFMTENGEVTTVHSYFENGDTNAVMPGSESEKTVRNKYDYVTSPGKFVYNAVTTGTKLRLIHGYMNDHDVGLVPEPNIYVYSRGTVIKFSKLS